MDNMPVFNEFGFIQTMTRKISNWVWFLLAAVISGIVSFWYLKTKAEKSKTIPSKVDAEIA